MRGIPRYDFMRYSKATMWLSAALVLLSLLSIGLKGFNLGIDFTGGILLDRQLGRAATAAEVRDVLQNPALADLNLGGAVVQPLDEPGAMLIRVGLFDAADIARIDGQLADAFEGVTERRTDFVTPVIGAELVRNALIALAISAAGVLGYVWFRFELKFAVAAIATSLHDVIIVLGVFSYFWREINTPFIAAVLTVLGYSINDTIVIFDRIREHLQGGKTKPSAELVNLSLNETLSRTINTSLTTLFVVVTMFLFGGETIRDFVMLLMIGIVVGTYSSIFLASPLWLQWRLKDDPRRRTSHASTR